MTHNNTNIGILGSSNSNNNNDTNYYCGGQEKNGTCLDETLICYPLQGCNLSTIPNDTYAEEKTWFGDDLRIILPVIVVAGLALVIAFWY